MARCFTLVVALQMFAGSAFAQAPDPNRPEPLICKPAGQAPFAVVIWNHGLVRDAATFANAQRGWRNMCEALAAEGYLAYIPIRRFVRNLGPADITREADELSKAVNTVIAMPDVDRTKVAIMGHSRGATLALIWLPPARATGLMRRNYPLSVFSPNSLHASDPRLNIAAPSRVARASAPMIGCQ